MIELMQFWFFSGCLLAGAAWSIDALLRGRGVQLRGVWAGAMGLTVLSPILPRLGGLRETSAGTVPVALSDIATVPQALPSGIVASVFSDSSVAVAWAALTTVLLVAGAAIVLRLGQRASTWRRDRVRGQDVLFAPTFGPAVIGLRHPRIVLPEALHNAPADDLEMILRHEQEHVQARDPLLLVAGALFVACMPWNLPLIWQATRLKAAVEEDCDLRVLRSGASRRSYADLLVRMASRPTGFGFAAAAMSERRSGLRRRLERLRDRRGQTRTAVTALLVIAGAGAIGVWMGLPSPIGNWNWGLFRSNVGEVVVPAVPPIPPVAPLVEFIPHEFEEQLEALERSKLQMERARVHLEELSLPRQRMTSAERLKLEAERLARTTELQRRELELKEMLDRQRETTGEESSLRFRTEEGSASDAQPLIYVDGERFFGDVATLDPDGIARVEVLKGAAAEAMAGPDARNGVVSIFLKKRAAGGGSN